MKEILYIEVPTPDTASVQRWLQVDFVSENWDKLPTATGLRLKASAYNTSEDQPSTENLPNELSLFVWSLQRTTYLKVFRWAEKPFTREEEILQSLTEQIRNRFPCCYPEPPIIDAEKSIFAELEVYYPLTVKFFQKMPHGEYHLKRVYWWEQRWRTEVRKRQKLSQVVVRERGKEKEILAQNLPRYDIVYIGGALGVIQAAVMAKLGYKVLLVERLPFGKMNREWNISLNEIQSLVNLGLLTSTEVEAIISREYKNGFNKFFDGNNPPDLKAPILFTPTVLNLALDSERLLRLCGQKLEAFSGEIWGETEFIRANITDNQAIITVKNLSSSHEQQVSARLLVDAMGTASPIAWQLNGGRAFDSVCPTVGAVIEKGITPEVWDSEYGDVLHSHGDISRGRQLIWELFPGSDEEMAIYLFHYHEVCPENPGSLLEMYEDFFTILPEYRRCDLEQIVWKKPTFGYIPGHFSRGSSDRTVAFDRLIAIGDAASLQSPLVFTGFGSLVRNLERLTTLLDTALKHNLLSFRHLNKIRAYQSNVAVTWLFSKGMMVPTGKFIPPQRINAILNTFFGLLGQEKPELVDNFIKDRCDWITFNRLAFKAAKQNPALLLWILELAGGKDLLRWLGSYIEFTRHGLVSILLQSWLPHFLKWSRSWLESRYPELWLNLLAINYAISIGNSRSRY